MGRLVEFSTDDGSSILVEVSGQPGGVVTRGIRGPEVADRAKRSFEEAIYRVQPAMHAVVAHIQSAAQSPDEIQVAFGVNLHAEAGAFIAAASATANFTVTLTWHRDPQTPSGSGPG
ncbi:CU044_2847 family protein [Streptomyces sp. NPDC053367]|uniref:CU044_2847 family protein n=1 Tax=Streptomyces sp. NPDC053367 TaxID=3365700 RepID=UPI0037CE788C